MGNCTFLSHSRLLALASIVLITAGSCSIVNTESEEISDCILEEIQFDQFNTLKFQTISGGRIYQIRQELTIEDETKTVASFQFNYFKDSLSVVDQLNGSTVQPFLTVILEDDKPKKITRFFSTAGVRLIHEVSYPESSLIRTDLTRVASTGDTLYVGYSNYHTGTGGNILRNERFRADDDEPSGFIKIEDRIYTYDDNPSPQENLFLPFFSDTNFPDVKFFSPNNILSYTEDGQTFEFSYEYGESNHPVSMTLPFGQSVFFGYVNCPT